ncbi:MAG: molybdopterin-dependent oxidoreductase [Coriobacteriales bacterium]|jgi:xanthine dehydrogenase molybdenum-binding subunit|nr:molybdopterin-dependent oxidoreductase [Coriobacteriales bacterium]
MAPIDNERTDFRYAGVVSQPGRQSWDMAEGVAKYQRDMTKAGMLFGRALRSPYGRAAVEIIDTSAAEALEGVELVLRWDDEDLAQYPLDHLDPLSTSNTPALSNEASFEGDECGVIVVARTDELCRRALDLIKVDWSVLPHIIDPRVAATEGAPLMYPNLNDASNVGGIMGQNISEVGNIVEGFAEADHIEELDINWLNWNHFRPMPQAYLAYWEADPYGNADYGKLLYMNGDHALGGDNGPLGIARYMMGFNEDNMRATSPYTGGRYCNNLEHRGAGLSAYISKRVGRPVRWTYSRRDEFAVQAPQNFSHFRFGFTNDGQLTAVQHRSVFPTGVLAGFFNRNDAPYALAPTLGSFQGMLTCKNLYNDTTQVYTNRAIFGPEPGNRGGDIINMVLTRVAHVLGKDPIEVFRLNLQEPGYLSFDMCAEAGKAAFDWDAKRHAPGEKTLPDGRLHGAAVFASTMGTKLGTLYNMNLCIKNDGKVYLPFFESIGGIYYGEMFQTVVAEEMGMKLEDVIVYYLPNYANWNWGLAYDHASSGTYAAKESARMLKEKILQNLYARVGAASPEEADIVDSQVVLKVDPSKTFPLRNNIPLRQLSSFSDASRINPLTGVDRFATSVMDFCEVAVDPETGEIEILDYVTTHDFGKVFRRSSAEGQLEMFATMAAGITRLEEVVCDENTGVLLNGNPIDYKVPTRLDTPFARSVIVESRNGYGAYGSASMGHSHISRGLMANAVSNALGVWVDTFPYNSDRVLRALEKIQ